MIKTSLAYLRKLKSRVKEKNNGEKIECSACKRHYVYTLYTKDPKHVAIEKLGWVYLDGKLFCRNCIVCKLTCVIVSMMHEDIYKLIGYLKKDNWIL